METKIVDLVFLNVKANNNPPKKVRIITKVFLKKCVLKKKQWRLKKLIDAYF